MFTSRTIITDGDPVIDCTGQTFIVTDCCGAVRDEYTINIEEDRVYCGTDEARGRCDHRPDVI